MSLQLVIDGYNYIGFKAGLSKNLEVQRNQLIVLLSSYQKIKKIPVCVVFDGWKSGEPYQHFEMKGGIEVIYSRAGEKADQVIIRLINKLKEKCIVVSSDREIMNFANQNGATSVTVKEFDTKLQQVESFPLSQEFDKEENQIKIANYGKKTGNPKKRSKQERMKQSKLKKL